MDSIKIRARFKSERTICLTRNVTIVQTFLPRLNIAKKFSEVKFWTR